jgi:hypothetical protein
MALTTSLISYWELEEASGTRNDSHSTNHLTDNNTVLSAAGKVGNAADFERDNGEFLDRADNAALSTGNIDFTVCAWIKLESLSGGLKQTIVAKGDGSNAEYVLRTTTDDKGEFFVYGSAAFGNSGVITASTFGTLSTGTWYFFVAWHDSVADTLNIQINNGTPESTSHTLGVFDSTAHFQIGSYSDFNEAFDGLIDQVGFWKRVLTAPERTSLYNSGNGLSYAALSAGAGWGGLLAHKANRLVVPFDM